MRVQPQCDAKVTGQHHKESARLACPACGPKAKVSGGSALLGSKPVTTQKAPSVHRAASGDFDPQDYEFLGAYDLKSQGSRGKYNSLTEGIEWAEDIPHGSQCSHCGSHLRYVAVLKHQSGEHITVGETCLGGRFSQSKAEFQAAREAGKAEVARMEREVMEADAAKRRELFEQKRYADLQKRLEKVAAERDQMFASHPSQLAMVTYPEMFEENSKGRELAVSMSRQLDERPTLSDSQVGYFLSTVERDMENTRKQEVEKRRKEQAIAAGFSAPRGDGIEVEGVVSSIKIEPNPYQYNGTTKKMRVALPGGAGVYVTVPKSIDEVSKGDKVRFTANFKAPNDDDPMFAWGSRPKNAQILP